MFNLAARSRNAYSRNCWKTSENKEEQKRLSSTGKSFQDRQFMHITWQSVHARVFPPLTLFEGESPGEWGVVGILNSTKRVNE